MTFGLLALSTNAQITNATGLNGNDLIFYEDTEFYAAHPGTPLSGYLVKITAATVSPVKNALVPATGTAAGEIGYTRPVNNYPAGDARGAGASVRLQSNDGSANYADDVWIVVNSVNLSSYDTPGSSKYFTFSSRSAFREDGGTNIDDDNKVYYTTNFDTGTDPTTTSWTELTTMTPVGNSAAMGADGVWTTQTIDLSSIACGSKFAIAIRRQTSATGPTGGAFSSTINRNGQFFVSDLVYTGTLNPNVMSGSFSALNTGATGQASIFKTPTAAISNANFSNTSFSNIFTTNDTTPRFIQNVTTPAGEGYKFEVSANYNPIVVTEVFYKLFDATPNRNADIPAVGSTWIVQGSNDDSTWDDLCKPRLMTYANSGVELVEYPNYVIPLTTSKAYRYYRFVLTAPWTSNSTLSALREIDFKVAALWQGASNTDWSTGGNWNTAVVPTNEVVIPSGITNFPTIPTGTAVTTNNITIASGATLVTQGTATVTGNVTYKRNITHTSGNLEGWHLVGAPVTGQAYDATYVTNNSIASSGANRGIATYNNAVASGNWTYLQSAGSGTFTKGMGYSVKTSATIDISFKGSLHTSDPELVSITGGAGTPFNLISNPFAAFVNAKTFLDVTANAEKLTSKSIWIWNPTTKNYETKLAGDPQEFLIAPGQGFFVSCATPGDLEFAKSNQVHSGTETFLKSASTPEIVLKMISDTDERFAKIRYQNEATTSFDNGYDGETFSGDVSNFDVFTQLIENTTAKKYQIQAIPNSNYENMVVPVGVTSSSQKEITFKIDANNIPDGYHAYLEDRKNNQITLLSDANTFYKTTVESGESLGRFFMHLKTSSVLSSDSTALTGITIYTSNNDLKIIGLNEGKTTVSLYSVLGKKVLATSLNSTGNNSIKLPNLAKGIYVVTLQNENKELNKKIIIE